MQSLRISQYQVANTLQSILLKFDSVLGDNWEDAGDEGSPSFAFNVPHKFQNKWYFKLNTSLACRYFDVLQNQQNSFQRVTTYHTLNNEM